jgi:ergothioneine biosynthesis protein EgtB
MTARVNAVELAEMMRSARQRTLELIDGLTQEQLMGPRLPTVNPLLWEIGHVAWFHEYFILRREYGASPILERGDQLYDSIAIAHDRRWDLPLYSLADMRDYMTRVLESLLIRLGKGEASERDSFLYQFTTFHEDMHDEAFTWARQTLAYPMPDFAPERPRGKRQAMRGTLDGDAVIPGGLFPMGSPQEAPFLFDNEKWAHPVTVAPFRMARAPVTNAAFVEFVEGGCYGKRDLWCDEGWAWRQAAQAMHPAYWKPDGSGGWRVRRFDRWEPLPPDQPVVHVNWHEANAWCRWAGRRLPSEAEWEFAATMRPDHDGRLTKARYPWGDETPTADRANLDGFALGCADVAAFPAGNSAWGCRQMLGNVWEWTADVFGPYPGFAPDDYKEYSEPLFGQTRMLRGGAWMTRSRMATSTYRNYFGPERRDIFAGFRTCAL